MRKSLYTGVITVILCCFGFISICSAGPSDKATYVGSKKCKMCHINQYKSWEENMPQHVGALKSLPADKQKDPECVKCHVTGYGKESGFKDETTTPDLAGVTCEACHGPGSEHVAAPKEQKKATVSKKADCTTCHNPHESFKKKMGS